MNLSGIRLLACTLAVVLLAMIGSLNFPGRNDSIIVLNTVNEF